jgi:hypothetical protein
LVEAASRAVCRVGAIAAIIDPVAVGHWYMAALLQSEV